MITKLSLLGKKSAPAASLDLETTSSIPSESRINITSISTETETITVIPSQRESPNKTNRGKAATKTMRRLLDSTNVIGQEEAREFFHSWMSGKGTDILIDFLKFKFENHWLEHYQRIIPNIFIDGQEVPICDFSENLAAARETYKTKYPHLCTIAEECGCTLLSVALEGRSITFASKNPCALEVARSLINEEARNTERPRPYVFLMRLPANS